MKAIVTGGAGFIGSHLADRLISEGHDVIIVDNLFSGNKQNIPARAKFIYGDITKKQYLAELPRDVDVVFHLASHVGQESSFNSPLTDLETNTMGTAYILDWCKNNGVKKFVFASSVNVYGNTDIFPITENNPISIPSPYAVGKMASEHLLNIYSDLGVDYTIFRLFNIYGPRQDMKNMKQGMASIYMGYLAKNKPIEVKGSMDRFRDMVYISDAVDAFMSALMPEASCRTFNVCTGVKVTVRELIHVLIDSFGYDVKTYPVQELTGNPYDQFGFFGDFAALNQATGWTPKVNLANGMKEMANWIKGLPQESLPNL